jgi:hypothetical protein
MIVCKDWYRLSRQPRIWRSFIGEWFGPDFLEQEAAANEGNEEEVLLTSSALLQASTLAADSAGAGEEGIDSSTDASPTSSSDADTAARNVFMSKYKVLKQYQETVRRADAEYDEILGCSKSANTSWQHVALDQYVPRIYSPRFFCKVIIRVLPWSTLVLTSLGRK